MKIGKYISELLFEKDFVILPGFGEFSTKYIPARFVPELKKVEKPSKIIAFSDRRKNDDDVLSSFIAQKENIEPEKAKSFIEAFVKEMNDTLKSGKSVELEKVGKFSPGPEDSINFEPDKSVNYLKDSYGMGSTREPEKKSEEQPKTTADSKSKVQPEKEETKEEPAKQKTAASKKESEKPKDKETAAEKKDEIKSEKEPGKAEPVKPKVTETQPGSKKPDPASTKKPETTSKTPVSAQKEQKATAQQPTAAKQEKPVDQEQQPKLSPAMKWIAFVAVPFLVIIIILSLNFRYIIGDTEDKRVDETEKIGFIDRIRGLFVDIEEPADPEPVVAEEEVIDEPDPEKAEPDVVETPKEPEPGRTVYHIVVGSFAEKHNAEIMVDDLHRKGAEKASIFEQTPGGLHRVSYGFYYSMNEAERDLQSVKESVNRDAWILKR